MGYSIDSDALRHFLALSRTLHFGRASRECHLSRSALSRSIQRLEAEVGFPLFERDNRSVALTAEGRSFEVYAADARARWEAFRDRLDQTAGQLSGTLSIFATVTACYSFLPRKLGRFREAHPNVHLQLETGNAEQALEELDRDAVDVSVAALPDRLPSRLEALLITRTPLIFVAPVSAGAVRRSVERRPIRWSEVPMVLPELGLTRRHVERWFRARRTAPLIESEVSGNEAILSLVALGCGVGAIPRLVLEKSPLRSEVRAIDTRPALPSLRVGFCVKRRRLTSPLLRAFWDSIVEAE